MENNSNSSRKENTVFSVLYEDSDVTIFQENDIFLLSKGTVLLFMLFSIISILLSIFYFFNQTSLLKIKFFYFEFIFIINAFLWFLLLLDTGLLLIPSKIVKLSFILLDFVIFITIPIILSIFDKFINEVFSFYLIFSITFFSAIFMYLFYSYITLKKKYYL